MSKRSSKQTARNKLRNVIGMYETLLNSYKEILLRSDSNNHFYPVYIAHKANLENVKKYIRDRRQDLPNFEYTFDEWINELSNFATAPHLRKKLDNGANIGVWYHNQKIAWKKNALSQHKLNKLRVFDFFRIWEEKQLRKQERERNII